MRGPRRSCTALYEAAPSAVGRGPNRDHRPWTGRGGFATFASTHAHLGTAGRETILANFLGSRAVRGPEELRDSEWTYM